MPMRIIWRTLGISLKVTLATIVLGYPLAYWTTRLRPRLRMVVLGLITTKSGAVETVE